MGLKRIVGIRQLTRYTPANKMVKMYEVTFETEKTEGEFTFEIPVTEYSSDLAISTAKARAVDIDAAIDERRTPPAPT